MLGAAKHYVPLLVHKFCAASPLRASDGTAFVPAWRRPSPPLLLLLLQEQAGRYLCGWLLQSLRRFATWNSTSLLGYSRSAA